MTDIDTISFISQIKLADFGFARHFKDEGMKPIDMTSLAGTPVFMVRWLSCSVNPICVHEYTHIPHESN